MESGEKRNIEGNAVPVTGEAYVLIREMAHAVGVPRRFSWHVNENLQTVPKFTFAFCAVTA